MTRQNRPWTWMLPALLLAGMPGAPGFAADEDGKTKNQKLIESFTPYERAMYLKQKGETDKAIELLAPMAAQGHGYEMAQLSLGQCYIDKANGEATPEARHEALVTGATWIMHAADAGLPAAQVQAVRMMLDGGHFSVEPIPAGMWYLIWRRNPGRLQTGVTDLDPALMRKLQSALSPEDWKQAEERASAWQPK